jgi:hypothetical protein
MPLKKRRGYISTLAGHPLSKPMLALQLGDCRKLFRYRAAQRGATPTTAEIDEALYRVIVLDEPLPELYAPVELH